MTTARVKCGSMVNCSRLQSIEQPSRRSWPVIVPPLSAFHSHTLATNSSRRVVGALVLLRLQLALDHHLRGDAGVVGADHPQRILAAQPLVADHDVLQRVVERVADVQRAGDVGRRVDDGEGLGVRPLGAEQAVRLPVRIPAAPRSRRGRRSCRARCGRAVGLGAVSASWRAALPAGRPRKPAQPARPRAPDALVAAGFSPMTRRDADVGRFHDRRRATAAAPPWRSAGRWWCPSIGPDRPPAARARRAVQARRSGRASTSIDTVGAWTAWRAARDHDAEDRRRQRPRPSG